MTSKKSLISQRGKYADLIDAETWAFIDKTNASYPEDAAALSVPAQRDLYDQMCEQFRAGYPSSVIVTDTSIEIEERTIFIRRYQLENSDPKAQLLYFHGGGFVVGGLESHDDICAELCAQTGYRVTSVDYRLAPAHVFPAAHDDAIVAYRHLAQAAQSDCKDVSVILPMILVGDSAGGNLAASVAQVARGFSIKPIGQILIYPGLAHDFSARSYTEHANAPMLSTADLEFYRDLVTGGVDRSQDPRCAPLVDADFGGLPPTYVFGAGCDPLLDDGRRYCERINAAGGKAHFYEEKGLVHGYLRARHSVRRAKDSFERIVQACKALVH